MINELNKYRFLNDEEPTDEQLSALMHEVSLDVKERADIAEKKFWKVLDTQINAAFEREGIKRK